MSALLEQYAHPDPIAQLQRWLKTAEQAGLTLSEGMALSTVGADGQPASRVVLLKAVDQRGLVFYTNYDSRKAAELDAHPRAALLFWWPDLERQVRLEGSVERTDGATSDAYFLSRPRGSRISAWASPQSRIVTGRPELQALSDEYEARFDGREVTRPPYWGGYRLVPARVEFWQGRARRLHDRLRYERDGEAWSIVRLAP